MIRHSKARLKRKREANEELLDSLADIIRMKPSPEAPAYVHEGWDQKVMQHFDFLGPRLVTQALRERGVLP